MGDVLTWNCNVAGKPITSRPKMQIAKITEDYKQQIQEKATQSLTQLFASVDGASSQRDIERSVWTILVPLGAFIVALLFALRCLADTQREVEAKGLQMDDVDMRLDADYHASLMTTFGPVRFPLFAYKRKMGPHHRSKMRVPCKEGFLALYLRCRSSELCVEWETRLGSDHPFRLAQDELNFFTHGAVTTEDNTIGRHLVRASASLERQWLYRKPEEIRKILAERAMCDLQSRLPVIYMSSDAHALRRYVDETWDAKWKMANGLRLWCVDRDTGEHIHLGGEFTWGDCKHVTSIFEELIAAGILPVGGDYGDGVKAQYVWLSDGAPWFEERLVPLFGESVVVILDVYHVLERAAAYADAVFAKPVARDWYTRFRTMLLSLPSGGAEGSVDVGKQPAPDVSALSVPDSVQQPPTAPEGAPEAPKTSVPRKGHKKERRSRRGQKKILAQAEAATNAAKDEDFIDRLTSLLSNDSVREGTKATEARESFLDYLGANDHRIDFPAFHIRGLQIGSGAMESMHRTGSQLRLKRPGITCLPETSQALFDWRMLKLVGRWDEFWSQPDLGKKLARTWGDDVLDYELEDAA